MNWGPLLDSITLGSRNRESKMRNLFIVFDFIVVFIWKISKHFKCISTIVKNKGTIKGQNKDHKGSGELQVYVQVFQWVLWPIRRLQLTLS